MKIDGRNIVLDGNEIAHAIDTFLVAHGFCVDGSRTIHLGSGDLGLRDNKIVGDFSARVYVDSGRVIHRGKVVIDDDCGRPKARAPRRARSR